MEANQGEAEENQGEAEENQAEAEENQAEAEVEQQTGITTETHRLIKTKNWNAVNARLATDEGKNDATVKDEGGHLIFHLKELFDPEVPLKTLRAAHDANEKGFVEAFGSVETEDITYSIFLAIKNSRPQVISFLLQLHPDSAKQKVTSNRLPLHFACIVGNDEAVRLLLSAYPAAAGIETKNRYYPLVLSTGCSFETQLSLLSAFPDIIKSGFANGNTLLHCAASIFKDYRTVETILHASPGNVKTRNDDDNLPIHVALGSKHVPSLEYLDVITQGDHAVMKEKGRNGTVPLHTLCGRFGGYTWVNDQDTKQIVILFREVLRRHPKAAHAMAKNSAMPLDCILEDSKNVTKHLIPALVEIWCSLVALAPQSLHQRHHDISPFVKLSQMTIPPKEVWTNAARYFPTALCSLDEKRENSALSNALYETSNPEELLDSSSYSYTILKETFRCLRHFYYHDDLAHNVIDEDVPVLHMLSYCNHLLDRMTVRLYMIPIHEVETLQHLFSQRDLKGNTFLHTWYRSPCPKEKNAVERFGTNPVLQDFSSISGLCVSNEFMTIKNKFGDLPIHFLLRNRHPLFYQFNDVVDKLMEGNKKSALLVDSQERLYPFMLAALNVAQREKSQVCTLTFKMLQLFVASAEMSKFCSATSKMVCSRKRQECECVAQDCIQKKKKVETTSCNGD